MPTVGPIEIIVVILVLIVIFGPKRIPELGRSVGQGMRNFKQSVTGRERDDKPRELEPEHGPAPARAEAGAEAETTPPPRAAAGPEGTAPAPAATLAGRTGQPGA